MDKLIVLVESPVFTFLRLDLLDTTPLNALRTQSLLKALYGVLMLIPQSESFERLKNRLDSATRLHMAHNTLERSISPIGIDSREQEVASRVEEDHEDLLEHFEMVQNLFRVEREKQFTSKSILAHHEQK